MKARRTTAMAAGAALLTMGLFAAPSVEITAVQQQYPWTNTVDITYEVQGVTNMEYFVRFTPTTSDDDPILNTEGEASIQVALESNGVFTAQWYPQTNLQYTACKMTPAIFRGGSGGGNDYMIVDLLTGAVTYEPMATQEASNQRYNTDEYKTKKLVLRKVSEGSYTIGHSVFKDGGPTKELVNSQHEVTVPSGTYYYIGIFPVTVAQYDLLMGTSTTSTSKKAKTVSWNALRGGALSNARLTANKANTTSFLIRLSGRAELPFDLPTLEMHEIATRAGATTAYFWGDTLDTRYCRYNDKAGYDVGLKLPNAWGLFDCAGNVWEYLLDTFDNKTDYATKKTDIYTPMVSGTISSIHSRAGCSDNSTDCMYASFSGNRGKNSPSSGRDGFRVAVVFR